MTEQDTPKMIHDEMIDTLKGLVFGTFDRTTAKEREALDMAISALSENKGDLISRQAVLAIIEREEFKGDAIAEIEKLPSVANKGEWIPVSERLPEIHQYVLLSLRSLDVEVGFRAETEPYFYCHGVDGCYVEPQNVLAWQPLPEPYKAEKPETCKGCLEPCIMYEANMRACKHKVTEVSE